MLKFKCNECDDSVLTLDEDTEVLSCPDCDSVHTLAEAKEMFDAGDMVGILNEDEDPTDDSFKGFSNKQTWAVALTLENEYPLLKQVIALGKKDELTEDAVKGIVTSSDDLFEGMEADDIDWFEVGSAFDDQVAEAKAISADLVEALAATDDLSDEVKGNVTTIFEAAVQSKVNDIKLTMEDSAATSLEEAKTEIREELETQVDEYLGEVVTEWMEENKLAVDEGIQHDVTKSFMDGLQGLFKEHYIDVPEDRYDILSDLADKVESLEGKLAESKTATADVEKELSEMKQGVIVAALSEDLTDTDSERLAELAESVDYESEESFKTAVSTLKESFLSKGKKTQKIDETDDVEDETDNEHDDLITQALKALKA